MSIEGLAASYFTDWSVPTYKELAFKGIKAFSFITIICPIAIGLTWAGCALYNRISRCLSGNQEATSKKVTYVAQEKLPISSDAIDKGQTPAEDREKSIIKETKVLDLSPSSTTNIANQLENNVANQPEKKDPPSSTTTTTIASQPQKKEVIFPAFLADLVQAKQIPVQEHEIEWMEDVRKLDLAQPATVIVGKASKGIALKLKIKHLTVMDKNISDPYDHEEEDRKRNSRIDSAEEFTLFGYACINANSGRFQLADVDLKHRGGVLNSRRIFDGMNFKFNKVPVTQDQIDRFSVIECQDQLVTDPLLQEAYHGHSLEWVLTRLLNDQSIKIREWLPEALSSDLKDPVFGYWEVTLAKEFMLF